MAERKVYRDAVSGEYVTEEYAAAHPETTVAETVADESPTDGDRGAGENFDHPDA